jgi:hypothetical protein
MYAFLTLLSILIVLFVVVKTTEVAKSDVKKEGFVGYPPLNTDSRANIPDNIPPITELPVGIKSSDLPGSLPTAPYQQIGANLPSPYQDPSLIKTTRQRILNVLELLKGFLAFQATEIEDRSDPTIQLPLNTARSDFQRLESEASVLQRNPGLTPHMTVMDIAQIEDNLAYLQKEVELIGSNRPFQGPQHDVDLEGFEGDFKRSNSTPATKAQLANFSTRLQSAITTLTASGTTDPVVQVRVGNLTVMKQQVDSIISKLNSKQMSPNDVPILATDIQNSLPNLGNPKAPLTPILTALLGNSPDLNVAKALNTLNGYAKTFLDNAEGSISFNVNYSGDNVQNIKMPIGSSLTKTGFPSPYDLQQVSDSPSLNSIISGNTVTDIYAQDPRAEGRTPATGDRTSNYTGTPNAGTFDWRSRYNAIVEQVKKRGLKPEDYGILPSNARVGPTFSSKGQTKTICSRLQATNLNKMDEMCGCPPSNWKGWNA